MNASLPFQPVIRRVQLRTRDADRLARFYQTSFGLQPREDGAAAVSLCEAKTGEALVTLVEDRAAPNAPADAPGLFHMAFLFPDLAAWRSAVRRVLVAPERFHGASDHGVSWAVYLEDPDGNGLELAWDKPQTEWPWRGERIQMVTAPLPLRSILASASTPEDRPGDCWIGHLHLQVSDLQSASEYQRRLGLKVTQADYPGALFLAQGRYHHHLALNMWRTQPGTIRPEKTTGLIGWEMNRDDLASSETWREPTGALVTLRPV